jgi:hypothetical protein
MFGIPTALLRYVIIGLPDNGSLDPSLVGFATVTLIWSLAAAFFFMLMGFFASRQLDNATLRGDPRLVIASRQALKQPSYSRYALWGLAAAFVLTLITCVYAIEDTARMSGATAQLLAILSGTALIYLVWFLPLALFGALLDKRHFHSLHAPPRNSEGSQP